MTQKFTKTNSSFLEAGLPCASLSAECQRDNNARQRPPQNRLHIWWARRPPTICRAAVLAGLLPHDLKLTDSVLPNAVPEPSQADLESLPPRLKGHEEFFKKLLVDVPFTCLTREHENFTKALGITGDVSAACQRISLASQYEINGKAIQMPAEWGFRHMPAFRQTPSDILVDFLSSAVNELLNTTGKEVITALDSMAGGGAIPLEAVRYGFKVFANDLNPVAALVLKSTIEYPARHGSAFSKIILKYAQVIADEIDSRLRPFFYHQPGSGWWPEIKEDANKYFTGALITERGPGGGENIQGFLWARQVPCPNCGLNIPLSTNFLIVQKAGKPEETLAAFPEVPERAAGDTCTFRIVRQTEWKDCKWPKPGFDKWHPRNTPTFKGGNAICPRCGHPMNGEEVKDLARSRPGGLPAQMYAVASKVPVRLTYKNGDEKIRYMWRFRAPSEADFEAVQAAEKELRRLLPKWEAQDLVPEEEIPEGEKTKEPRNMGLYRWRDFFLPRQLLTNMVVLEEIRKAQEQARKELPADEAEAVGVYLAFILSKVVNYNSVNTFWHYGRKTVAQSFSRHDFAFRPAFCEFEGARETVMWGANQVVNAYEELASLIHGNELTSNEPEEEDPESDDAPEQPRSKVLDSNKACLRSQVIVPTVTCEDAAALTTPAPGTVHLICVDPPYYNNVQYSELSNFFYVWLKRALRDFPGLAYLFQEPLAESNREAVANAARWQREAETEMNQWQARYDQAFETLRGRKVKVAEARAQALERVGSKPLTARERADRFYEDKMSQIFRRARHLLHPAGRMVVMFNHKQTWAWRSLGMALIRAGFEIRSSAPIHTEAESSLNIRGLDAARSTVLLLCLPREESEQSVGNWAGVQTRVGRVAQGAADLFHKQGLKGTDLYLSSLGPALGEVARNWPVTDFAGHEVDLGDALEEAYRSVGHWRLEELFKELTGKAELAEAAEGFAAQTVDRDTQTLWLWLDTFEGETAGSDDLQKLAKSLNVDPRDFEKMGLVSSEKDIYVLRAPQEVDLRRLSLRLRGETLGRGRTARVADAWEERTFPNFTGAAVWNAIALMSGSDGGPRGADAVKRWLRGSGYDAQREFFGAYAITLHLLERVFLHQKQSSLWHETALQARRAWDLAIKTHRTG
jgi:putative DNA methylase